jgi:hypothetical protein
MNRMPQILHTNDLAPELDGASGRSTLVILMLP